MEQCSCQKETLMEEQEYQEDAPGARSSSIESSTSVSRIVESTAAELGRHEFQVDENSLRTLSTGTLISAGLAARPPTPVGSYCRICHDRNLAERNVTPCHCRGSLALVHLSCLQMWLATSDTTHCEICGYQYTVFRLPKYSVLKSIWYWYASQSSTVEGRAILKSTASLISEVPLVFSLNYLWLTKVDGVLDHLDKYARTKLDGFDVNLMLAAKLVNISLVSPLGLLSGGLLMVFIFRIFDLVRRWYFWYRKECILVIQLDQHQTEQNNT